LVARRPPAGDRLQSTQDDHLVLRLSLRLNDGSLYDETTDFQHNDANTFRVLSDRLVETGPSFRQNADLTTDPNAPPNQRMPVPADVLNGLLPIVLKSFPNPGDRSTISLVIAEQHERLVKLQVTPNGSNMVTLAGAKRSAARYEIRAHLGGPAATLATIAGRQPPMSIAWVIPDGPAAPIVSEVSLYEGPVCTIEVSEPAPASGSPENAGLGSDDGAKAVAQARDSYEGGN
jgi:hypothetical protein